PGLRGEDAVHGARGLALRTAEIDASETRPFGAQSQCSASVPTFLGMSHPGVPGELIQVTVFAGHDEARRNHEDRPPARGAPGAVGAPAARLARSVGPVLLVGDQVAL